MSMRLFSLKNMLLGLWLSLSTGVVANELFNEYAQKSSFLLNLARLVEWPNEDQLPEHALNFCFMGDDSFGDTLNNIRDKTVRGHQIAIKKHIQFTELDSCHLVFIDASEHDNLETILDFTAERPILTVGDVSDFAIKGGLVNLINYQERILLEINLDAAQRTQLRISSRLLSLARLIEEHKKTE